MSELPAPTGPGRPVADTIGDLDGLLGRERFVEVCVALLEGADRTAYLPELRYLTGHAWEAGDPVLDRAVWKDYWVRTWGARGLLHRWHDRASRAIVRGLQDEHYRPAEMCLKVAARHEVAGTGPGAAALSTHRLPRVRTNALRALAIVGDTEHVAAVRAALDDVDESVRVQAARALERMVRRVDLGPDD